MKTQFKILTIIIIFASTQMFCKNNETKNKKTKITNGKPKIEFINKTYDLGTLTEGETAECIFFFKNTGNAPLKIKNIETDCGCTVAEYSDNETKPGEKGKIRVTFNSGGFRNNIMKEIYVKTNADTSKIKLVISVFVKNNNNLN